MAAIVELVMAIEEEFGMEIPNRDTAKLDTVGRSAPIPIMTGHGEGNLSMRLRVPRTGSALKA